MFQDRLHIWLAATQVPSQCATTQRETPGLTTQSYWAVKFLKVPTEEFQSKPAYLFPLQSEHVARVSQPYGSGELESEEGH